MTAKVRASASFRQLIEKGRQIVSDAGWNGRQYELRPTADEYFRFRTEAMNLVRRTCGPDSDHYLELKRRAESTESATNPAYFVHCLGVLEAAQSDFDAGLLFHLRALIAADILGDFIEQAEQLLAANYHVPAASLAGAVLEGGHASEAVREAQCFSPHVNQDRSSKCRFGEGGHVRQACAEANYGFGRNSKQRGSRALR